MWETVIGSLIGSGISVLGGLYILHVSNKHDAARKIGEAFALELSRLQHPAFEEKAERIDPSILLHAAFEKHRTAVMEFKRFLKRSRQREIDRAWRNYYAYDDTDEHTYEHLVKYSPNYTGKTHKECVELAIANMEKLLHFARGWGTVL